MWSQIISSSSQTPLSPCDNYRPVTIFEPCPEVVIISDIYCNKVGGESKELHVLILTKPFHTGLYKGLNAICYL